MGRIFLQLRLEQEEDKLPQCHICSKRFTYASRLNRHLNTHDKLKPCKRCGKEYIRTAAHHVYCQECGEFMYREGSRRRNSRAVFQAMPYAVKHKERALLCLSRLNNIRRKVWGSATENGYDRHNSVSSMGYIRKSEIYAKRYLESVGFTNVVDLNAIESQSYFDLKAEKEGRVYVFQVTTNMTPDRQSRAKRRKTYAEALGLTYRVVFVKPDMTQCLIREHPARSLGLKDFLEMGLITEAQLEAYRVEIYLTTGEDGGNKGLALFLKKAEVPQAIPLPRIS